ncbi:hypothetical protein OZX62_07435 [Bifidobacterium sp. ESL0690]|uniref:hypothetical protein n=1 Tax=Bifidobacterium sp. ESL0690 TaxID=2983214 RepID=UPI0023F85198|nr:hypothetical protein [Bifidobacterium sp. ESL0690]WEV46270.1 hypothetical protein OZX62_07435 [Bifidobacterium sp. ESL0690]
MMGNWWNEQRAEGQISNLLADGSAGAQSAAGSGGRFSNSSPSAAWSFDFTLTGPMWWEFAMASNAYGRGLRKIFVPGAIFLTVLDMILFDLPITTHDDVWELAFTLVLTCVFYLFCGGLLPRRLVMNQSAALVSVWFPVSSRSGPEMRSALAQWKDGDFDGRWLTPSRLQMDSDGLTWMWAVAGDVRSTSVRWADLDCVRLTDHAVVFSPSAGGKASMDIIPEVPDVKFMDLNGCVMLDRLAVPDVDGFVRWCRKRVAEADRGARHASRGSSSRGPGVLAVWWGRFRRWLYGDDEFLDGPPKNWLRGLGFRDGSGSSV